jgi:tRNA threonylcarbamoyladenosine biosynthesis protein TsaB
MKILAVDTATTSCSVAVVHNDAVLAETTLVRQQTHSKHLMEMIDHVLGLSGLTISALNGFALTIGPGTFTGLRIGLGTIKGLAMASHCPVVGISSLDALAMQAAPTPHMICSMIDARRKEVYFSAYRLQDGRLKKETKDVVLPPEAAAAYIEEPCVFVGSGALTYRTVIQASVDNRAYFMPPLQNIIKASTVAHLSMPKFKSDNTDQIGSLVPYYIRRPDAELKRSIDNGL